MNYIDDNLMSDEKVSYRAKLHWIVFKLPAICLLLALILFISGNSSAGGFLFIIAIVAGIVSFINYSTSEFGITNKRVMVKVVFISRKSLDTLLTKVEGVQVDQGILGRILGYGTIVVTGTGGSKEPFPMISAPLEFRKKVQEQVSMTQAI